MVGYSLLEDRAKRSDGYGHTADWLFNPEELLERLTTPESILQSENSANQTNSSNLQPYQFYKTEQLTFLCILFALIVIGNVSVLVAIFLSKTRKSRMNFFIMHLALADLTSGLVTVLTEIIWKTTVEWHAGTVGCKIVRYLQSVATYASTYVLVALSIDRFDAIARPMSFSGSGTRAKFLIGAAWGLSLLFSMPMLILCEEQYKGNLKQCQIEMPVKWGWKFYITLLAFILFIIPAIIIGACYSVIVFIIWRKGSMNSSKPLARRFVKRNGGNKARDQPNHTVEKECHTSSRGVIPKARIKTIKMTLVIVLAFVFCWSPYFIFDLLDVYRLITFSSSQQRNATTIFIQSLSNLNSAANPVIYCLFSTRICSNWRRFTVCDWLARKLCPCCLSNPNKSSHHGFTTTNATDYTTVLTDARGRTRPYNNKRRHSGTPFVKVTLSEHDNEILMNHIKTPGQSGLLRAHSAQAIVTSTL